MTQQHSKSDWTIFRGQCRCFYRVEKQQWFDTCLFIDTARPHPPPLMCCVEIMCPCCQAQEAYVLQVASLLLKMDKPVCIDGVCYLTSTSKQYFSYDSAEGAKRRHRLNLPSRRGSLGVDNFPISIDTLTSKPCGCGNSCHLMHRQLLFSLREVVFSFSPFLSFSFSHTLRCA